MPVMTAGYGENGMNHCDVCSIKRFMPDAFLQNPETQKAENQFWIF